MSFEGMLWACKHAPVADVYERAILMVLGEAADDDGCGAWPAQATIAEAAMTDSRTVRRRLAAMEERGLIARGDQRLVESLPADRRPVVWDVLIPAAWFPDLDKINRFRKRLGRPEITPQSRPRIAPPPERARRADTGKPKARKAVAESPEKAESDYETGGTTSPAGLSDRNGGSSSPQRGVYKTYKPTQEPTHEPDLPAADASGGHGAEVVALFDADRPPSTEVAKPGEVTAQTIVSKWVDRRPRTPSRQRGQIARESKRLLADGFSPREVWLAIEGWAGNSCRGAIDTYLDVTQHARASTTDQRVAAGLSLVEKFAREEGLAP